MSDEVITWTQSLCNFALCSDANRLPLCMTAFRAGIFSRAHGTAKARQLEVTYDKDAQMALTQRDKMSQHLSTVQLHHSHLRACRSPEGP
jgi:hypothetical protein